jgi:hypothetical protein
VSTSVHPTTLSLPSDRMQFLLSDQGMALSNRCHFGICGKLPSL